MELLTTKFYKPWVRSDLVGRERLRQKLDVGVENGRILTLISAPAGYGKTTLAAEWLPSLTINNQQSTINNSNFAWLSLDENDNDPIRFFAYLVEALQRTGLDLTVVASRLQGLTVMPPVDVLMTSLLNAVSNVQDDG
ncbi:MAG: LuxR family transcriptional regulator, partial [Chloroflexi bacterium]